MNLSIVSLFVVLITACGDPGSSKNKGTKGFGSFFSAVTSVLEIQVLDHQGLPLRNTEVLMGMHYEPSKIKLSNENGFVEFELENSEVMADITLNAQGFIRMTQLGLEPGTHQIRLNRLSRDRSFGVGGVTTGFGKLKKDKWADFSMVAPVFSKAQLIGFDLSFVISDQMDIMSVYGQDISIPSNISFPKQKENYGIFPVTLNKPSYRMPFYFAGTYQLAALHGRFPFKKVVGKMRKGDSVFDVINDFEYKQIGITELNIDRADHKVDLPINQISFSEEKDVFSPNFSADDIFLSIALNSKDGRFFPSGIKKMESASSGTLRFAEGFGHHMLAVLGQESKDPKSRQGLGSEMSIQVLDLNKSQRVNLLEKVDKPIVIDSRLVLDVPDLIEGLTISGTYLSLTTLQDTNNPHIQINSSQKRWEVYSKGWVSELKLPDWPAGLHSESSLRWEVMFLGSSEGPIRGLGPVQIMRSSHVSRTTLDY